MATYYSGQGGKAVVGGTDFDITDWEFTKTARIAETTHSGSSGWATFKHVLKEGAGTFNYVWDADAIPDTDVSLDLGDTPTLLLHAGSSTKFYSMTAVIESVKTHNDAKTDVVRGTVTFKASGAITDPVT